MLWACFMLTVDISNVPPPRLTHTRKGTPPSHTAGPSLVHKRPHVPVPPFTLKTGGGGLEPQNYPGAAGPLRSRRPCWAAEPARLPSSPSLPVNHRWEWQAVRRLPWARNGTACNSEAAPPPPAPQGVRCSTRSLQAPPARHSAHAPFLRCEPPWHPVGPSLPEPHCSAPPGSGSLNWQHLREAVNWQPLAPPQAPVPPAPGSRQPEPEVAPGSALAPWQWRLSPGDAPPRTASQGLPKHVRGSTASFTPGKVLAWKVPILWN